MAALLETRIHVLEVLSKARWIATNVERALIQASLDYESGLKGLKGLGAYAVMREAKAFAKRLIGSSQKVIRSQWPPAYVQEIDSEQNKLSVSELATITLLCDIDPFLITGQNVLLHDELVATRHIGRLLRGKPYNKTYVNYLEELRQSDAVEISSGQEQILRIYRTLPGYLFFENSAR